MKSKSKTNRIHFLKGSFLCMYSMNALNKMIEQLKDLNEKNATLASELESEVELNKQK